MLWRCDRGIAVPVITVASSLQHEGITVLSAERARVVLRVDHTERRGSNTDPAHGLLLSQLVLDQPDGGWRGKDLVSRRFGNTEMGLVDELALKRYDIAL